MLAKLDAIYVPSVTTSQRNYLTGRYTIGQGVDKLFDILVFSFTNGNVAVRQTGQSTPFLTMTTGTGSTAIVVAADTALIANVAATAFPSQRTSMPQAADFFPLQNGKKWNYSIIDTQYPDKNGSLVITALGGNKTEELYTYANTIYNKRAISQYVVDANGISVAGYTNYLNGVITYVSSNSPYMVLVPANLSSGAVVNNSYTTSDANSSGAVEYTHIYSANITVIGIEKVSVPAGTFDCVRVQISTNLTASNTTVNNTIWLAKGVGLVKSTYDTVSTELVSYQQ